MLRLHLRPAGTAGTQHWPSFMHVFMCSSGNCTADRTADRTVDCPARRYAALLSSEAVPGGLMDPAALGRLRAELMAGAAAAAATSGIGYKDLVQEASGDVSLRCASLWSPLNLGSPDSGINESILK